MKENKQVKIKSAENKDAENEMNHDGYPLYPIGEDIYNKNKEEEDIDPENLSQYKQPNENDELGLENEKDFGEDESGSDLDVPNSELDDLQEDIGSEDEENNYYSIGGDDHNDLDEDRD
jgi:hypothetical protein